MINNIQWLGHGGFVIHGPPIIYISPLRVTRTPFHADAILVGHDHYDHCSAADIAKLRGADTKVIGNDRVAKLIPNVTLLRPWHSVTLSRASIKAVPAYSPGDPRHPAEDGGLGFVISLNYYDIYYAGDTGRIPEMQRIHPDIAILPIDGNGTLTVEEAVEVVKLMRPRWVIPCNWGASREGATRLDALRFKALVAERATVIIPDEKHEKN
jgi:L-ascorbate metabolism protein UlaG (beta-lactamase superfamily)